MGEIVVNPTPVQEYNVELASAQNVTGTATLLSAGGPGTAVDIPGVAITVPVCTKPVVLMFKLGFTQTGTGAGDLIINIIETTGGGSTVIGGGLPVLPGANNFFNTYADFYRLGPVVSPRTFKLQVAVYGTCPVSITNNAQYPSELDAVSR